MFEKANKKLGLNLAVLGSSSFGTQNAPALSGQEIDTLLKKGAVTLCKEDDDDENIEDDKEQEMLNEDIESILSRATVVSNDKSTQTSMSSFGNKDGISFDDENFWAKMLPGFKNAAALSKMAKDKEYMKVKANRQQFLADCISYFARTKEAISERSLYASLKPSQEVDSLFNELEGCIHFDKEEMKVIKQERNNFFATKRRNVRSEKLNTGVVETKKSAPSGTAVWPKTISNNVRKALFKVPYGRWDLVAQQSKLPNTKTIHQLQSFCENVLYLLYTKQPKSKAKDDDSETKKKGKKNEKKSDSNNDESGVVSVEMESALAQILSETHYSVVLKMITDLRDKTNPSNPENKNVLKEVDASNNSNKGTKKKVTPVKYLSKKFTKNQTGVVDQFNLAFEEPSDESLKPGTNHRITISVPTKMLVPNAHYTAVVNYLVNPKITGEDASKNPSEESEKKAKTRRFVRCYNFVTDSTESRIKISTPGFVGPYSVQVYRVHFNPTNEDEVNFNAVGKEIYFSVSSLKVDSDCLKSTKVIVVWITRDKLIWL
eukprot:TRINITY_DN6090_c0_g1_i2.p1 TRINITY_DN6090_c0_g1~~TRINITY_DN6090_c0_g1_i2.p1  ORF type:complete len:569 (+),score=122.38 TRINITY_DN6090_c0_g1_i2:72-1709(+)